MELAAGGSSAAKRAKLSSSDAAAAAGGDRLSALPDDVVVLILLHLSTSAAARTSVLSRRWRRVWAFLPELCFHRAPKPHRLRDTLDSHEVPIRNLLVETGGGTPESPAIWLPAAARRVSGSLILLSHPGRDAEEDGAAGERRAFELPCFEKATSISLFLWFDGLAVPPAGVFARLTGLYLSRVSFLDPGLLGDVVSSQRCPCLQKLAIDQARGLGDLAIHSESLLEMELKILRGLSQLTIVAPALTVLTVTLCFHSDQSQPAATIWTPRLVTLNWRDEYDPSFTQLGTMAHLRWLGVFCYLVYGQHRLFNDSCLSLLQRFKKIEALSLTLGYVKAIEKYPYLMDEMTVLPDAKFLCLAVSTNGHAFGPSAFHVLRLCTGIKRLRLQLLTPIGSELQAVCRSGCICDQPADWEIEELPLNHLEEVEIEDLRGSEHEVAFAKRLFSWGTKLKEMTVNLFDSVSEIKAKELYQMFQSFTRPGICMKIYIHRDFSKVLYTHED